MVRSLSQKSSKRGNASVVKRASKGRPRSAKNSKSNKVRKSARSNKVRSNARSNKVRKSSRNPKANRSNKVRKNSRSNKANRSNKVRKSARSNKVRKSGRSNKKNMRGGTVLPSEYFGGSSGNYHAVGSSALAGCPRQVARSQGVIHADGKFAGPILHPKQ
jgi:hypothetical protein